MKLIWHKCEVQLIKICKMKEKSNYEKVYVTAKSTLNKNSAKADSQKNSGFKFHENGTRNPRDWHLEWASWRWRLRWCWCENPRSTERTLASLDTFLKHGTTENRVLHVTQKYISLYSDNGSSGGWGSSGCGSSSSGSLEMIQIIVAMVICDTE